MTRISRHKESAEQDDNLAWTLAGLDLSPTSLAFTFIAIVTSAYVAFLLSFMFRNDRPSSSSSSQLDSGTRSHSRSRSIAASIFGSSRSSSPAKVQERKAGPGEGTRPIRQLRPPPLTELTLQSAARTNALTRTIAREIRSLLPPRLQLHDSWQCLYNLDQHGVSLGTLYANCHGHRDTLGERPGFVLVVQDGKGAIFGAFVNEHFRPAKSYFGNGECFLYKTQMLGQQGDMRFKAFPWTGLNDYQIYCTADFLSVGGGDGKYGLWLDDRLEKGLSSSTLTFGNETLCDAVEEGRAFDVQTVEVWKI